jgi:hypothetical protein
MLGHAASHVADVRPKRACERISSCNVPRSPLVTLARVVQLPAFAILASLLIVAGPQAGVMTIVVCLAIAAATAVGAAPSVVFSFPAWVFRALTIPSQARGPAPVLARAWWIRPT